MPVRIELNHEHITDMVSEKALFILPDPPSGMITYGGDADPVVHISAGREEGYQFITGRFGPLKKTIIMEAGVPGGELPKSGMQVLVGYRIEVIRT